MRETRESRSLAHSTFLYATEGSPRSCNRHLLGLGQRAKASLSNAGVIAYQFGTVGVSDGISMGTRGMSYSLQSRDLIADQVETAAGGHWLDGMVVIPGCDKNMPGVLMARTYFTMCFAFQQPIIMLF
jgi:dihydroxy-acid dehydratase